MTYAKPEVVELVRAAQAVRANDGDTGGDNGDKALHQTESAGDGTTSSGAAYQADE